MSNPTFDGSIWAANLGDEIHGIIMDGEKIDERLNLILESYLTDAYMCGFREARDIALVKLENHDTIEGE